MIRLTEELSLNAWPSLQTIYYDGWLLCFSEGYTRRACSVNPLYASSLNVQEKIRHCEEVYASKGQPTIFKMTPAARPARLDEALEAEGYQPEATTSVQGLALTDLARSPVEAASTSMQPTKAWLADYCLLNRVDQRHAPTMMRMLGSIAPASCFASVRKDGETAAVGMAVLERGYVGLFDIVTATPRRNQGLGAQLVLHLLSWGIANGAHHAYLQVMTNNAPALHLYAKLGFKEMYRYWYRVQASALVRPKR